MRSSVVIIGNPAARRASAESFSRAEEAFLQRNCPVKALITEQRGDATRLARMAVETHPRLIMAAGGDGTINEVANGMAGSSVPLAILPLGTTNVLAREIGFPTDPVQAVEAALSREPKPVSLGKIGIAQSSVVRYFLLMAGFGFDARAVHDMNPGLKRISGPLAYVLSGIGNVIRYRPAELTVVIDGKAYRCFEAIVGKAGKYGGDFMVTPGASLFTPSLQVCLFQGRRRRDLLRYAWGIVRGTHLSMPDVLLVDGSDIEVKTVAHVQIDGDDFGMSPARITIEKDCLHLIC